MARFFLAGRSPYMISLMLLFGLLLAALDTTDAQIGVCYGMHGNNLPSKSEVIALYNQNNIRRLRLYGPEQEALQALEGTSIEVMLGVGNENLESIASSQTEADTWVQNNVRNYNNVNFRYIAVGNEVKNTENSAKFLVPAMQNIQNALNSAGLGTIKVSTASWFGVIDQSFPPSEGSFKKDYMDIIDPIIKFLSNNNSPLLFNVYPYFAYQGDPVQISLDYALFRAPTAVVSDLQYSYQNLFDAMLDSVYAALEKASGVSLEIVVSESGWPTNGGNGASIENARVYNNNLIQHVNGGTGTPKRPGRAIETYIFAMFDENEKPTPPDVENYWGLFHPSGEPKYTVNFS